MLSSDQVTDPITYNVRERGRAARGQDRNFDLKALAKLINGPEVQEKVRHGDMFGYFGHWPRRKLGMEPAEVGMIDGKLVSVPTAIRTVELRADEDGNITHRAQFLATNEGRIAARLYLSKAGGFSSAITPVPRTSPIVPAGFYGFDYVLEPNYTTNRGHKVVLDGAEEGSEEVDEDVLALLDSAVADATQSAGIINQLFDSLQCDYARALQTIERITQQNIDLVDRLAKGKGGAILDGAALLEDGHVSPIRVSLPDDYGRYRDMDLAKLQELPRATKPDNSPEAGFLRSRFGMKV